MYKKAMRVKEIRKLWKFNTMWNIRKQEKLTNKERRKTTIKEMNQKYKINIVYNYFILAIMITLCYHIIIEQLLYRIVLGEV